MANGGGNRGSSVGFRPFFTPPSGSSSPTPEYVPLEEPAETAPPPASGSQRTPEEVRSSLGVAGGVRGTPLGGGAYQQPDGRIVYLVNRSAAVAAASGATPEEQVATRGQEGDALALMYGYAVHGGTTFFRRVDESGGGYGDLVIGIIWGMGPIDAFVSVRNADGTALDTSIEVENYRGDPADGNYDTVDNKIVAADPTYNDTLVETDEETGLEYAACYTVFRIPASLWRSGWPQFQAWIAGHPVYDPRDGSQTFGDFSSYKYTTNAALIQADLYTHPLRGMGRTIDWSTVIGPANSCQTGPRFRGIHTRFELSQPAGNLLDVAGEYASTTIVADQDTANMVELKDETPIATLTVDDTIGGFTVVERPSANVPDIVEVDYSAPDPSETYRRVTKTMRAKRTGLTGNAHPYIRQRIPMPGFIDEDQAYQYAVRRLNGLRNDLEVSWVGRDSGLEYTRADVVNVQDSNGLSNLRVRIVEATLQGRGRYQFKAVQDTPQQYSTDPAPAVPDVAPRYTGLSPLLPVNPPVITLQPIAAVDASFYGRYYFRVTIPVANTWPWTQEYKIVMVKDPQGTPVPQDPVFLSYTDADVQILIEVERNTNYRADVTVVGPYGEAASPAPSLVETSSNQDVIPNPPDLLKTSQAGLDVIIDWVNPVVGAIGARDPNIKGWAIRRGSTSQSPFDWDNMTPLSDMVDVTYFLDSNPGPGDHRYVVRSVSIQTNSLDFGFRSVDITVDEVSDVNLCPVGDFDTWTEGTSVAPASSTEVYFADLFTAIRGAAADWSVSRVAGRSGGPAQYAVRIQRDSGESSDRDMAIAFALETQDVIALRGKYISISFWVQTGSSFESGAGAGLIARLRTNDTTEGSYYDMRGVNSTNQDLVAADGDMPDLPFGANPWKLMTAAFPNPVDTAAVGLAIAIRYEPIGTAGSQDWLDISELAFFATPYYDKSQDPPYKLPPPFQPLTQAARQAYIRRYLLYSGTNETPEFFEEAMRATPVESGSNPWKYDARL